MAATTLTDSDPTVSDRNATSLGLTLVYADGLRRAGEQVALTGRAAVLVGRDEPLFPGGPLRDPRMSGRHGALVHDRGSWSVADRGSKNGTFVNGVRVSDKALAAGDVVRVGSTFFVFAPVAGAPRLDVASPELVGVSAAMAHVREEIALVGPTEHTVLLCGESGTGKEVVARALHHASKRSGPLLAVNCASLRGELLESELFGHARGAFTGAQKAHDGLFVRGHGGTLLLDEVAETEEPVQARLLRVLEARAVRPVGATDEIPIATRVVAATNRDVEAAVRSGRLRADLYARLARWSMTLPPLRARREDLGVLTKALLDGMAPDLDVTPELMAALLEASWPLNVRGLLNVLTTARIAQPSATKLDLVPRVKAALEAQANLSVEASAAPSPDAPPDGARVTQALERHGGNLAAVARELDLTRQSLYRLLERLAIDPTNFRK